METKSLPKKVKVSESVLFQKINDECVLLNMENEQYFGLDTVGARVWEILAEDVSVQNVLLQLQNEYDVDIEVLTKDLTNLLYEFENEKLIVIES